MLTRSYALFYAERGAHVVVNDVSEKNAQAVVDEIVKGKSRSVRLVHRDLDAAGTLLCTQHNVSLS